MTGVPFVARVVHATTPTSIGTLDITTTTPIGTPKGAFILASRCSVLGTISSECSMSWGATDGTNNRSVLSFDRDNVGTTTAHQSGSQVNCLRLQNPAIVGDASVEAAFDSWINDGTNFGVRLNFTSIETTGWKFIVVLLAGSDCEVSVGDVVTSTAPTTVNVGFETDFVLSHYMRSIDESNDAHLQWCPAIATRGGNGVGFVSLYESEHSVATSQSRRITDSTKVARPSFYGTATTDETAISNFFSNGFEITNTAAPSSTLRIAYCAVKVNGTAGTCDVSEDASAFTPVQNPAGVHGTVAYTWPAHQSELLFTVFNSNRTALSSQNSGSGGMGVSDGITDGCIFGHSQHNVGTSNTGCLTSASFMDCYNHNAASHLYQCSVDSQNANGFTLDWTLAFNNIRLFGIMSVEKVSAYVNLAAGGSSGQTSVLTGTAGLVAASAGSSGQAAVLTGDAALVFAASGAASQAADLRGIGNLAFAAGGSSLQVVDMVGTGSLVAALSGQAGQAADLRRTAALVAALSGSSLQVVDLVGTAALDLVAAGAASQVSELTGKAALDAALSGSAGQAAVLRGTAALVAVLAGQSAVVAELKSTVALAFTGAGTAFQSADLRGAAALAFAGNGTAFQSADLRGAAALAFAGAGTAGQVADLTRRGALTFAGAGTAGQVADLTSRVDLVFTGGGAASLVADLSTAKRLVFSAGGSALLAPSLRGTAALDFAGPGVALFAGELQAILFAGGLTTRTCLLGSYVRRAVLTGSYVLATPMVGSYDRRVPLAGEYLIRTPLAGSYDRRTALAGDLEIC